MKKIFLIALASLLSYGSMRADNGVVITTKEVAETAGYQLTIDQFKALSGTGGHFAFHTTQRTDWSQFHHSDTGVYTLTTDQIYTLLPGSSTDCVWIANYAGEVITAAGNKQVCTYTANATEGFDFYAVSCGSTSPNKYAADKQFHLRHEAAGSNFRIHENDFTTATGDWTRYVAYGPFYVVNLQPTCSGQNVGNPVSFICSKGDVTLSVPSIDGYRAQTSTINVTVSADTTVPVAYSAFNPGSPSTTNLTPWPKELEVYDGHYTLPDAYTISVAGVNADALRGSARDEAQRFAAVISTTTGKNGTVTTDAGAAINLRQNAQLSPEGYNVDISTDGITVEASTATGFYYGLQTIKKLLPANVMAGTPGTASDVYALPCLTISDEPRFDFRSFMLDCSRHFFSVDELKRMLDVMAIYKMNKFHWHLTDDQGWRAEIKSWPKLTQEGATRTKNRTTPISLVDGKWWEGEGYMADTPYGPYFYSQQDMRDIVAYAAERHIEVIPEIEMPGHAVAALAAYPELSCNPDRTYSVWNDGGISRDVMNVASSTTMGFLHDVIDEICDIFPGQYFHIGGDECPTDAWATNAECQQFKTDHNLANDREIQSYFINQISEYLATKGKRTIVWNESITAANANTTMVKEHNPVIMCWYPCQNGASRAAQLGLDAVITEYHGSAAGQSGAGGYYINRRQSNDYGEPSGAGSGDDTVEGCYNYIPVPANVSEDNAAHYIGVQGTFWTEHVDSDKYLEYLALPRLVCLAEAGWVRQDQKNWDSFVERMQQDCEIFDLGGYVYGRHWDPNYEHRVYVSPIIDGSIVTFTNYSSDRGRCLADNDGTLNAQGSECTNFVLEATGQDGQYYIRSQASGKYLYAESTAKNSAVTLSNEKIAWSFDEQTIAGFVAICPASATSVAINNIGASPTYARLWDHASGNGSSFWSIGLIGNYYDDVELPEGDVVTFTNIDSYRGRCLADEDGTLNAQGSHCTNFILVPVEGQDGQYYICSELTGKYLYVDSTTKDTKITLSYTEKTAWTFDEQTKQGSVAICPANDATYAINNNDGSATHARLWDHGSTNDSSFWYIVLAGDADGNGVLTISDVTYTIGVLNGVKTSSTGADANGNGAVGIDDVTNIAKKIILKH